MTADKLSRIVVKALEDMKAIDIETYDVTELTSITDKMIFASGGSSRHVKALANTTLDTVKANAIKPLGVEGIQQGDWALIDLGDVIVHIMRPPIRDYYQLEKIWAMDNRESSSL